MIAAYHRGYVVDASVGVKWFIRDRDPERETALALRRRHIEGQTRIVVPELFLLEVPNAIKAGRKGTEKELDTVIGTLVDLGMQIESCPPPMLRKTNAIAHAYNLTWYDAVYIALAETVGFPCVTADEALLRKLQGHSIVLHIKELAFR